MNKFFKILVVAVVALVIGGCSSLNHHGEGTAVGAVGGAVIGYKLSGGDPLATGVGAILGGIFGGEVGEDMPKKEGAQERSLAIRERSTYLNRMGVDGYSECIASNLSADYCAERYWLQAVTSTKVGQKKVSQSQAVTTRCYTLSNGHKKYVKCQ